MGRALVIKGLAVNNPLTTVNLAASQEEAAIKNYLEANASINSVEKKALLTFVEEMIRANIWDKMKYFYPMIGNTVADITLEAISPNNEDLLSIAGYSGFSVSDRTLVVNNRPRVYADTGERAKKLVPTSIGFVIAGENPGEAGGKVGQGFTFRSSSNLGLDVASEESAFTYAVLDAGTTKIRLEENVQSYLDRIVFGNIYNGKGYLYYENELKVSNTVDLSSYKITQTYGVLFNSRTTNFKYKFFAITEGMTSQDWSVFYPLLLTFLQSVGKHD